MKTYQQRISGSLLRMIKKVKKQNEKKTGKKCSFGKASGLFAERCKKKCVLS